MQKETRLSYIIQNLILIAIIIVSSLISNLTWINEYTPFYEMTIIFFASVAHPRAIPLLALLVYGIMRDILFGYPIGFSSVLFLSFRTIIDSRPNSEESPEIWQMWLQFVVCIAITLILQAILASIILKYDFVNLLLVFAKRWSSTSLLYPVFHLFYSIIIKFIDKQYYYVAERS
jgi:hypothetical protein